MIYDRGIKIPVISPFNWEGFFTPEQYYNIEDEFILKYHNIDVPYIQFKSVTAKEYKLRIRDRFGAEIETFTFSTITYSSAQYKYKYDIYIPMDYDNEYYFFEIYVESENKVYADCEPFQIVDECLHEIEMEGYNDIDKDGFIYTETTGTLIETDTNIGAGTFVLTGENIILTVAETNSYTAELQKDSSYDDDVSYPTYSFAATTGVVIPKATDDVPYRILIKDGTTLLAYSNWFIISAKYTDVGGVLTTTYELSAQNRTFIRIEANFRPDGNRLDSTKKNFTEQDLDRSTTSSIESEPETLTIGWKGVPRWLKQKINRYLGLNHIYIKGEERSVIGDIGEGTEKENLDSGYTIITVDMQRVKHKEYSDNVVDALLTDENWQPLTDETDNYLEN